MNETPEPVGDNDDRDAVARKTAAFVDEIMEARRVVAEGQAREAAAMAEAYAFTQEQTALLGSATVKAREMPLRAMAAEIGAATRVNDSTVQNRLFECHRLVTEYAQTFEAWRAGQVSQAHTKVIVEFGADLPDPEARAAYEKDVLDYAVKTATGRLRPYAQQVADKLNPRTVQERHEVAACTQRVFVEDLPDGMSMLGTIAPSTYVHGAYDRATQVAREIKAADLRARREYAERQARGEEAEEPWFDDRTLDQIRADVVMDMLLTAAPTVDPTGAGLAAIRGSVQVSIPATTLAGTTSGGAELNGKCAIDPATVRILTGNAPGFDRVFLHPVTAEVLTTDRYTPTAGIKRFLQARYVRCAFPGCRRPAMRSEIDHHQEYSKGGKTDGDNLGPCCTRHHVTRHAAGWTVEQLPGGRLRFTAPSGKVYIEDPPPRVMFIPEPDPDPGPGPDRESPPEPASPPF
ncbi:DUF222 domain-containing protein [Microbacterium sp. NPDC077184]|uniref:HNH endonuclease signature motif containing protein n=1 Tax=Microbacterium sp. NPDC077184 TaxID=3154764 RepID=UPI00341CD71F